MILLRLFCLIACVVSATAAETTFRIQDLTGRGFAPDLIHYELSPERAAATGLRLYDGDGGEVPMALLPTEGGVPPRLAFVTDLPPNGERSFTLRDGVAGSAANGKVNVREDGETMVVGNGIYQIRVPGARQTTFDPPVAASTLPAPLLGFTSGGSAWLGKGTMLSERQVSAFSVDVRNHGPVFVEVVYRLEYAEGGFFHAELRVIDQVPMVKFREAFDVHALDGSDFWELEMTAGWQPNRYSSARTIGNGALNLGWVRGLDDLAKKPLWHLVPDSAWGTPLSHLGLFQGDDQAQAPADGVLAGWIPLHKGDWRRMNSVDLHIANDQVRLRFPLSVRHATWHREVTSETSPFSMQEHEPGLPTTYGRRIWGLLLAPPAMEITAERGTIDLFYQARLLYGVIGLDRYKDYVLDWPADEAITYPRVFQQPMPSETRQAMLTLSPLPDGLKKSLRDSFFSYGGPANADARTTQILGQLSTLSGNAFRSPTLGHHHIAANYAIAAATEDLLSWDGLDAERRREIRQRLALICYLYEEPDAYSYGGGSHSGNPNMNTARVASAATFMALIPDHPMSRPWHRHIAAYSEYKTGTQIAPGGGFFEYGASYHMHGGARLSASLPGLAAIAAPNLERLYDYWSQDWRYYMNLLTPFDSRWQSRMIPAMANSAPGNTEHLLEAAATLRPHDEAFASELLWAWLANGANTSGANTYAAPLQLPAKEPALKSALYPGVGAILRAHQGDAETYMLFRSGFNWSHWYVDQGHFILYSRGAAIAPFQPYQYTNSKDPSFDLYNTMRFGSSTNSFPHGWPDSNILDYTFSDRVDYLWSSTGYPAWYIDPGKTEPWRTPTDAPVTQSEERPLAPAYEQTQGPFTWDRQVIFLKGETPSSPNYFVFRDSMRGDGKLASWMYLNSLGDQSRVTTSGNVLHVDTPWDVNVDYIFLTPETLQVELHTEDQILSTHNANLWDRRDQIADPGQWWVTREGEPVQEVPRRTNHDMERRTFIRLTQPPGQGYHWIVWPRAADEAAPEVEAIAPGVTRITHAEGTDYVFLFDTHQRYEEGDLLFEGKAGAIRIGREEVTLVMGSGSGWIGWKGWQSMAVAPFAQHKAHQAVDQGEASAMPPGVDGPPPFTYAEADGVRTYRLDSAAPTTTKADGGIYLHGTHLLVEVTDEETRIIAREPIYTEVRTAHAAIRGVGPFDLTFRAHEVIGSVSGRSRSLVCSWPSEIVRPMFHIGDMRYYAGWADDHSYGKAFDGPQYGLAFGVLDGEQRIHIAEWEYPPLPTLPARRLLD